MVLLLPTIVFSDDGDVVELNPIDCGPLARDVFGAVFSAFDGDKRQTYFVKGAATEICPRIMESDVLIGEVYDLCRDYTPPDPNECKNVKEFVLKNIQK